MPVNAAESASLLNLAKSFTSSYEARDRLSAALREHLGVTPRDSFWLSDDGVDDVRGPVVIYRLERDCYDASGCGIAKCGPGTADEPFFRATYALTADGYTFGEPVKVRRVTAYEAILDAGAGGPDAAADETEVPEWLAHALAMAATLMKAAGHRYIRRVPKAGGGYRYFYKVSGGGGLGHEDEMKVGAKFRIAKRHKQVYDTFVGKDDKGNLRIKHDESGHESTLSPAALRGMLRAEHAQSLKTHREKLAADIKATDDPKAKARLLAEAGKYEHTRDLAEPGKSEPAKETAAPKADDGMNAAQPAAAAKHREESLRHAAAAAHWGQNAAKAGSADDRNESERVQRMHGRAASSHRRAADLLEREAPAGHHLEMHAGANADGQLADEEALFQAKRLGMPAAPAKEPAAMDSGLEKPAAKKLETKKSMTSTVTDPERDLAKSLAASHRAAAEAQPDAGAKDAHKAAAQACDAAAEADSTRDFRKALGAAERIGGLIKAWSGIPEHQRPPFADFRKSMEHPAPARAFPVVMSSGGGDAMGHLPAVVEGSRPPAEVTTQASPEPTTYSAQRGAVNGMRKSMGAFYGKLAAGAAQVRLDVRFPAEAAKPDGGR